MTAFQKHGLLSQGVGLVGQEKGHGIAQTVQATTGHGKSCQIGRIIDKTAQVEHNIIRECLRHCRRHGGAIDSDDDDQSCRLFLPLLEAIR